jgi:serine/threonine protein phosphatase PrpC
LGGHTVNQDALALCSREKTMVGVVCDGCGGSVTGQSNNEVGARIIAGSVANLLEQTLQGSTVENFATRIADFERALCERILTAVGALFPEPDLKIALHSYFMSTILAFAVDETSYVVFGCGDGVIGLNSEFRSLDQNSGAYLTGRLLDYPEGWRDQLDKGEGALRVLALGRAESLDSLLLASDGFEDFTAEFPQLLKDVLAAPASASRGFDQQLVIDFRARFWHLPELQKWAETRDGYDDRSFLLIRRIIAPPAPPPTPAVPELTTSSTQEAPSPCSTLPIPMSSDPGVSSPPSRKSRRHTYRRSFNKTPHGDLPIPPKD